MPSFIIFCCQKGVVWSLDYISGEDNDEFECMLVIRGEILLKRLFKKPNLYLTYRHSLLVRVLG